MLEVLHRDGRARILQWQPSEGKAARTPGLIHVDTTRFPADPSATMVLAKDDADRNGVTLVSDGTWFHPRGATSGLVVSAPQPTGTTIVQVLSVGDDLAVWHDAGGWAREPRQGLAALLDAKKQATPGRILWAPALGTPADYAVWVHLGIDAFDGSVLQRAAIQGTALTVDGPRTAVEMAALHGEDAPWDADRLHTFNVQEAEHELARIRLAIEQGTLRALAERRAYASPHSVALLRRADRDHNYLEAAAAVQRAGPVPCMTQESLWMPEMERFRRRMREFYRPPASADVLVLLPCSARKPYRLSKSHRYFGRALDDSGIRHRCHEVMVTSPLGIVPRDIEEVYPAANYDVPVTGQWNRDEEALIRKQVAHLLMAHDYKHVIAHVSESTFTFLRDLLPEATLHTVRTHRAQSMEDCIRLRDALRGIRDSDRQPFDRGMWRTRKLQDVQALAAFQFGPEAAADLVADAKAHGRMPYVKVDGPEGQRAMITDRGMLSLTLPGAQIIAKHKTHRVHVADFPIRKTQSLFAVGVEGCDPGVRPGDDVVIVHGDEVRGCGIAQMAADEMTAMKRGVAVHMRHVAETARKPVEVASQEVTA